MKSSTAPRPVQGPRRDSSPRSRGRSERSPNDEAFYKAFSDLRFSDDAALNEVPLVEALRSMTDVTALAEEWVATTGEVEGQPHDFVPFLDALCALAAACGVGSRTSV